MTTDAPTPPGSEPPLRAPSANVSTRRAGPLVVGIGASMGGLGALEGFLRDLEPDLPAAVVVVLHLDPTQPSMAAQILARTAKIPVCDAEDGMPLAPGRAYIIPPNADLGFGDGTLRVTTHEPPSHGSIDTFFRSLAATCGERAVGVVLSGAGSDGAVGLRAVKEHGGVTMAQAPEEAACDSMPKSAIALGVVDWVLPAREMPERIEAHARLLEGVLDGAPSDGGAEEEDVPERLQQIAALLLRKTGHDFGSYKQPTVLRRVQRRMRVVGAPSLAAYAEILRQTPAELERLFADLLIGVTKFFRDPPVFDTLASEVIPAIARGRAADREIRVWVPGCASGEEAYSLAILIHEAIGALDAPPAVKIFATDIDERALEIARQGVYPPSIETWVSGERLARFFRKLPEGWQVEKQIREACLFSTHNIVGDPPFSRLDLVSCRNLLIYLETELQKKLVPILHYALAPGGYLVLGPSENLAGYAELFRSVDKDSRIFQRLDVPVAPQVVFPLARARKAAHFDRGTPVPARPGAATGAEAVTRAFERTLLEEFAPPAVMVDEEGRIVYVSGSTGRFLQLPSGATRTNVVDMALPALRPSLHTALHRATRGKTRATQEGIAIEIDGVLRRVDLVVRPVGDPAAAERLYMIVFRDAPAPPVAPAAKGDVHADTEIAVELERELRRTREHLQTTIEQLEAGSAELQSANEELLSTNEELQSANEELQTSKEEQQSVNEELQTVNAELVHKVIELDRANSDLANLFASTRIASLFLDGDLRIKRYSPAATEIFRVIDTDVGRPVTDIAAAVADPDLVGDVREVLATLAPRDREVRAEDGRWFIRRIRPYNSLEDTVDGVVITLIDITDLKLAQQRATLLAAMVDSSQDAIVGLGLDGRITTWNVGAERIYARTAASAAGLPFAELYAPDAWPRLALELERASRGEHVEIADATGLRADGSRVELLVTLSPVHDPGGEVIALSMIAHDVTHRRRAREALQRSESRFRVLSESGVLAIAFVDEAGRVLDANDAFSSLVGHGAERVAQGGVHLADLAERETEMRAVLREMWRSGRCAPRELEFVRADRTKLACLVAGGRLEGGAEGVVILLDITVRRRALDDLTRSEARLRLAVDAALLGTWELDPETGIVHCSPRAREIWGFGLDEVVTYDARIAHIHPDDRSRVDETTRRALDPAGSGEYRIVYRVVAPSGNVRWIESHARGLFSEAGGLRRPTSLIGTILDITERHRSEEALREADARKDRFLAMLSHELRNPLAAIRSAAYVVGQLGGGSPSVLRAGSIVERQVEHMTHLLEDLLDVGRLASGRVALRKERVDIVATVRAAVDDQQTDAEAAGVALTMTLPPSPIWLLADPTRIGQSVTNLVVNALKFTPKGGHAHVAVAREAEDVATVTVRDDGVGIDAEMMPQLFEPFSQADRSIDRSRGGLGLGLSLVKSFVEMHGGSVSASSAGPGKGSTFVMRLPATAEPPSDEPASPPAGAALRVLVVEDNVDAAEGLAMLLELDGHAVAVAHDGPLGVARAREFLPDVVLCDIGLPGGMDGYDVARALRGDASTKDARLVAVTGYGQEDDKRRAHDAGFDEHVTKPVGPEALRRVLERP